MSCRNKSCGSWNNMCLPILLSWVKTMCAFQSYCLVTCVLWQGVLKQQLQLHRFFNVLQPPDTMLLSREWGISCRPSLLITCGCSVCEAENLRVPFSAYVFQVCSAWCSKVGTRLCLWPLHVFPVINILSVSYKEPLHKSLHRLDFYYPEIHLDSFLLSLNYCMGPEQRVSMKEREREKSIILSSWRKK